METIKYEDMPLSDKPRRCPLCKKGWCYLKKDPTNTKKLGNIWDCNNCVHFFPEEYFDRMEIFIKKKGESKE